MGATSCCCQKTDFREPLTDQDEPDCTVGAKSILEDGPRKEEDAVDWDSIALQVQQTSSTSGRTSPSAERSPKTRAVRHKERVGESRFSSGQEASGNEQQLLQLHRRPRAKDPETGAMIMRAMKQDRVCGNFEESELRAIIEHMEYFEFGPGDVVTTQGEDGTHFFVLAEGHMEVSVNGNPVNTLSKGMAFGSLSLLYNCPRTATVRATEAAGAWAADGESFKKAAQEYAMKHAAEHRKYLDSIRMFDGLTAKQKTNLGQAISVEHCAANTRVVTEGEVVQAIYFVKKGTLNCMAGVSVKADGTISGGKNVGQLRANDSFGERPALYNEVQKETVVTQTECELFTIGVESLKEVLGNDLVRCLEQSFILAHMRKSPTMSQFSSSQQYAIMQHMATQTLNSGDSVQEGLRFALVVDGMIQDHQDSQRTLERGQWYEDDTLMHTEDAQGQSKTKETGLRGWVAGPSGARVAILTQDGLAQSLKELGLSAIGSGKEVMDYTRKLLLVKKVHIFRHLSSQQINDLVNSFTLQRYKQGAAVIKQGEMGKTFFVIAKGEVAVYINNKAVRQLGKNAYFGERALLFDEPRTATIEVTSKEAELWSIEKSHFTPIVRGKMQDELVHRIRLQDTSVTLKDLKSMKVIGAGAAGVVRLVQHKTTSMRYALKRVRKEKGKIPAEVARECALLGANDHPFVMHLVKSFETDKNVYILTELITGGELHAAIRKIPTVLSQSQAQFYTGSLVLVLESLQDRNIVYRDLKPENVMLDAQGYLKLIDFGIAKKLEEGKSRTFTMIGTPHYMAPEVMWGHGYGTEVDIWSLGIMHYEFVCGYLPFADELDDPTEVCTAVLRENLSFPSTFKDISGRSLIQGLLSRQPKKRLGAGMNGYEDIRKHGFFTIQGDQGILFQKIMGRQLDPPVVPSGEQYSNPDDINEAQLSDKELLA